MQVQPFTAVNKGIHLLHQFACGAATKDPPGISLQGIKDRNPCEEIRAMR
jgi:hypothetical protein